MSGFSIVEMLYPNFKDHETYDTLSVTGYLAL